MSDGKVMGGIQGRGSVPRTGAGRVRERNGVGRRNDETPTE